MATGNGDVSSAFGRMSLDPKHIGAKFNQWVKPKANFYGCDQAWIQSLKESEYIGDIDFGSKPWARSQEAVDYVMKELQKEMRAEAAKYERLRIESYIRQGSSRDALKVIWPNEYDSVIQFQIEGLKLVSKPVTKSSVVIPGFCFFEIDEKWENLEKTLQKLCQKSVFVKSDGKLFLSSKNLHEKVLTSIVDAASAIVEKNIQDNKEVKFSITRKKNPPAINITIHLNEEAHNKLMVKGKLRKAEDSTGEIDLDIVPAIKLRDDEKTTYEGIRLDCPIHAVCKWVEGDMKQMLEFVSETEKTLVWHINSSGYEKHTLDVIRTTARGHYILTALRIMKTYFVKAKTPAKDSKQSPPQLVTVLKSYHLKQIALYEVMFTCHLRPTVALNNTYDALLYFISLLEAALDAKHLPHFYYSNPLITRMYPGYEPPGGPKYDLFRKCPDDALLQAKKVLQNQLVTALRLVRTENKDMTKLVNEFKDKIILSGKYF
ncbi:uncharacterized protein LOC127876199 [Dreissena polymorpha]|uniref:Mab-21-like nucleotidyltransferase domain-containing protein n=1 Tax=Dreissena polymorpha TaxID=45954 RepID=A0A9D4HDE1_DREPO|nr:uncharacterized protein LOC127876199 [Dreissena polymorpha]KAH3829652.1 hypothetical protein DPMN_102879 [Dreissena polymorpha]